MHRPPTFLPLRRATLLAVAAVVFGAHAGAAPAAVVGPDVISTVATEGTVVRGGLATFRVTVRNVGTAATDGPVRLRVDNDYSESPPTTYAGDGWTCVPEGGFESYCTLGRALAAGETAPVLTVQRRSTRNYFGWDSGDQFVELEVGPFGASSHAQVPVVTDSLVDLGMTGESLPADRFGPRDYDVRVRNGDGAPTDGPIIVALRTGANGALTGSGDGWTCDAAALRCEYRAVLAPRERAPVLHLRTTRSSDAKSSDDDGLSATLTGGGDDDKDPDEQLFLRTERREQLVDLVPVTTDPGVVQDGVHHVGVRVEAVGPAESQGPVRVVLTRGLASTPDSAIRASGTGWSCVPGAGACTYAGTIRSGTATPTLDVSVPLGQGSDSLRFGATVSGGGDSDPEEQYARDNDAAFVAIDRGAAASGPALRVAIPEAGPMLRGATTSFVVATRNPAGAPTRSRPVVRLLTGFPAEATGDGWTCNSRLTCRLDGDVRPDTDAPPIRVRIAVPSDAPIDGTLLRASTDDTDTGVALGTAADTVAAAGVVVQRPGPLVPGEAATVETRVTNDGQRPIAGPVTLTMAARIDGVRFDGDGWTCDDSELAYITRQCTHAGPIPADGTLPPILTTFRTPTSGSSSVGGGATLHLGPRREAQAPSASWSAPVLGRPVDLTVTAEDPRPQIGDEPGTATLVVRNRGIRPSPPGVEVSVPAFRGARSTGDGWTCGRICRHDGAVPPGGSLPPIRIRLPLAEDGRPTVGLSARVTNAGDVDHQNDTAELVVPAATLTRGRFLTVRVGATSSTPPRRGEPVTFSGFVSAVGTVPGPVTLEADTPPGIAVEAVEAEGLTCTAPTTCRWEMALRPDEQRPFKVRARIADDAVGPFELRVRATGEPSDVSPGTGTVRVVPEDSGADVTVVVGDAQPIAFGGAFRVPVVVRNGGSADSPGPVDVEFFHPTASMGDVTTTGPGWQCSADGRFCRWPGGLAAGAALPELTIRPNLSPEDYRFRSGPIVARVSDDADTQRANDEAQGRVAASGIPGPDLVAAVSPTEAVRNGDGAPFDVRVRNTGGRATTDPVQVDVGAGPDFDYDEDGVQVAAMGDGWRCSGRSARCTLDRSLAPGEQAPVLRTVVVVPSFPEYGAISEGRAAASARIVQGDAGANTDNNRAIAEAPTRPSTGADVVASVDDTDPVPAGGPAVFRVRVANVGRSTTTEPVEVRASEGAYSSARLEGDGWVCSDAVCRLPGALAPGAEAPVLRLEQRDTFGERVGAISGSVRVTGDAGGWTGNNGAGATVGAYDSDGVRQDLLPTIDDVAPARIGTPTTANVRVRNLGSASQAGPVDLRFRAGTNRNDSAAVRGGDGWSCTSTRCLHPGPVPPGGSLPPVELTAPAAGRSSASNSTFRAWVVPADGDRSRPEDARAAGTSLSAGRIPAALGVSIRGGAPVRPGEETTLAARVHNPGSEPYTGTIVGYLFGTAGRLSVTGSGDGWTCAGLRCERPGPLAAGEETPPISITARAPRRDGAGSATVGFGLRAPGNYPLPPVPGDWSEYDDGAYVSVGVGSGLTDLVPWVRPEVLPVVGGTASTLVNVRNVGSESSDDTTTVTVTSSLADARAEGDGWACAGLRCTRAGAVGATTLPPIRVLAPVPGGSPRGAMKLGVSVENEDDDATGNNATTWSTGIAGGVANEVRASPYFAVAAQHPRLAPGERAAFQLRLRGVAPADGAPATVVTTLPAGLAFAGSAAGEPGPDVDGRTLTWRTTLPDEDGNRTITFFATVADDTADGATLRLDSTLTSPSLASTQRRTDDVTVATPALSGVSPSSFNRGAPVVVSVRGAVLRSEDTFALVAGSTTITGLATTGDDERVDVGFDPRGRAVGTYDLVVRRASGGSLALPGAVTITEVPPVEQPPTSTPPTTAQPPTTSTPSSPATTTPTAPSNPGPAPSSPTAPASPAAPGGGTAAAALAALIAGLGGSAPPAKQAPVTSPSSSVPLTLRYVNGPRAPRLATLLRAGWLVTVRVAGETALAAELRADATTARRLGIRSGAVLARATSAVRPAGDTRLRLRVPSKLRTVLRRASRVSGILRTRTTSGAQSSSASKSVALRR